MVWELLVIVALVLANGVLAGAEIAVIAVRKTRIDHLVDEGHPAARAVKRLHGDPERFLATVQVGITVIGATAGAFGGSTFARDLEPALHTLPVIGRYAAEIAIAIVVVLVSYLSIVIGELVPKSLALRASERYALGIGSVLIGLSYVARPFVWLLTASSNAVLRLFGDHTTFTEARLSVEELRDLVDEAAHAGSLHPAAGEIAARAIDFAGLKALHVMVPRSRVVSVPLNASADELRQALESGHLRLPVREPSGDRVVGYLRTTDLALLLLDRDRFASLADVLRPTCHVPESMPAVEVLGELRRLRSHLAVVVEDNGAMSGIVTMQDLMDEIVGEILSEHGEVIERIRRLPDGSAIVRGDATVRDVNRELGLELEEADHYSTIAGLCLQLAQRIPRRGDQLASADGTVLEIVDATPRQISLVRVRAATKNDPG